MRSYENEGANNGQDLQLGPSEEWQQRRHIDTTAGLVQFKWTAQINFGRDTHKKNPPTLPIPHMIAAQAFPLACSARGRISTRRARSAACTNSPVRTSNRNITKNMGISPALTLKSMQYIDNTASHMVRTLFCNFGKRPKSGVRKERWIQ